jgi:hypothetical protein
MGSKSPLSKDVPAYVSWYELRPLMNSFVGFPAASAAV